MTSSFPYVTDVATGHQFSSIGRDGIGFIHFSAGRPLKYDFVKQLLGSLGNGAAHWIICHCGI
jgi:hypothetical protein